MSFKTYCDCCSKPIKGSPDRVRRILGKVMIEVMVRFENTWNAGHVCEACVIKIVNEGRPRQGDESYIDDLNKERAA